MFGAKSASFVSVIMNNPHTYIHEITACAYHTHNTQPLFSIFNFVSHFSHIHIPHIGRYLHCNLNAQFYKKTTQLLVDSLTIIFSNVVLHTIVLHPDKHRKFFYESLRRAYQYERV